MDNLKKVSEEGLRDTPEKKSVSEGDYTASIVRDFYGVVDPFYLNQKDPNYAYRFLRDDMKSGGKNVSIKTGNMLFQKGGWQLCPKEHLLKLGIKNRELSADNLLRRGDTILAFMPKKLYDEKEAYKAKLAKEPQDAVKRMMKDGDTNIGGKEVHETMRGLQTQKSLKI